MCRAACMQSRFMLQFVFFHIHHTSFIKYTYHTNHDLLDALRCLHIPFSSSFFLYNNMFASFCKTKNYDMWVGHINVSLQKKKQNKTWEKSSFVHAWKLKVITFIIRFAAFHWIELIDWWNLIKFGMKVPSSQFTFFHSMRRVLVVYRDYPWRESSLKGLFLTPPVLFRLFLLNLFLLHHHFSLKGTSFYPEKPLWHFLSLFIHFFPNFFFK